MPVAILIYQGIGTFDSKAVQTTHLFVDKPTALEVFENLKKAITDYHNRSNDREKLFTFECMNGPTAIDVSHIACVGVDDLLDPEVKQALFEWNQAIRDVYEPIKDIAS